MGRGLRGAGIALAILAAVAVGIVGLTAALNADYGVTLIAIVAAVVAAVGFAIGRATGR